MNREAPLVRNFVRNTYRRVADTLGVERYQSVPLYLPGDTLVPERYGRDGTLACLRGMEAASTVSSPLLWKMNGWFPAAI
mgnify:FL=1